MTAIETLALTRSGVRTRVQAPVLILLALALTWAGPLWLLLLAPIVLGVPHVVGDLRCLILQRPGGMDRMAVAGILLPLFALTLLRTATVLGAESWPRVEIGCGVLAILAGGLVGMRRWATRLVLAVALGALAVTACAHPIATILVLAHAHNLVGFLLFLAWAKSRREAIGSAVLYGAAATALGLGLLSIRPEATAANLAWTGMAAGLAPGLPEPAATRLVLTYAFAQAVHYALWVWLIPRHRSDRSLVADLGGPGLWLAGAATLLVPALAWLDPAGVRGVYLSLVMFHGWLELAVVAFLWGRRAG